MLEFAELHFAQLQAHQMKDRWMCDASLLIGKRVSIVTNAR